MHRPRGGGKTGIAQQRTQACLEQCLNRASTEVPLSDVDRGPHRHVPIRVQATVFRHELSIAHGEVEPRFETGQRIPASGELTPPPIAFSHLCCIDLALCSAAMAPARSALMGCSRLETLACRPPQPLCQQHKGLRRECAGKLGRRVNALVDRARWIKSSSDHLQRRNISG